VFGKIAGASAAKQALPRVIEAASRQVSR
jgi:hypothetical protein